MQPSYPVPPPPPSASHTSGMAIAGFVCSFFCGILGLVFSIMGRNECRRSGGMVQGEGLATAGMIISIITILLSVVGVIAAVSIPAFMDYSKKTRKSEAVVQLNKIGKRAQEEFVMNDSFPREAAPLTPSLDCCSQNAGNRRKCASNPADWSAPAWRALDFDMFSDHYFRYSYEPRDGGRSFIARAVGDLDCDGTEITYELRGSIVDGYPQIRVIEPPPNSD